MTHVMALSAGTELVGDFRIERVLGAGGFGITYLADEIALARSVTIKEYFPSDFAARGADQGAVPRSSDCSGDYKWGLDRFIEEAQTLARFDHRNICRVYRYFRANNTGYMVLHFEEGASLKGWLKALGRAPRQTEIDKIVGPLLDALELIHKAEFLHRDIAPDNIMLRKDGSPVLIDFGSARGDIARHSRTVSALVKPGYSPYEQYAEVGAAQGPWSDIYAFAATLYHAITGKRPPDSPSRIVKDDYVGAKVAALAAYRPRFLAAIDWALELDIARRPQSVAQWRGELLAAEPRQSKKSWLSDAPAAKPRPAAKAKALAAIDVVSPQPLDASRAKGGILDFFEGLKKKGRAKPVSDALPELIVLSPPPPPPSVLASQRALLPAMTTQKVQSGKAKAQKPQATSKPLPPPPTVRLQAPAALPRPRRGSAKGFSAGRRLTIILLLGAGLTSAAVGLRDRLPLRDGQRTTAATPTAGSPAVRKSVEVAATLDIKGHPDGTVGVGFAGDDVVTAGSDRTVKVWNGGSGALQRTIAVPGAAITAMAIHARRVALGQSDGSASLWDLDRGEKLVGFKRNEAAIWSVAFAGAGDRIVTAGHDWSVAVWDSALPSTPLQLLEGHESAVQAVAFSASKGHIVSGGADRMVKLWSIETGNLVRTYRGNKDFISAVDVSPDGRLIASAGLDGTIRISSTASNRHVATLLGHRGRVGAISFAPSGETLASVGDDGSVRIWDARRGRSLRVITATSDLAGALKAVSFSGNGRRLVTSGDAGVVMVRDIELPATSVRAGKE